MGLGPQGRCSRPDSGMVGRCYRLNRRGRGTGRGLSPAASKKPHDECPDEQEKNDHRQRQRDLGPRRAERVQILRGAY